MNPDTLMQSLQTGFRATVGAASSALESLQDPQKRDEYLSRIQRQDWDGLIEELAEKGEMTEQEARRFVDGLLAQQQAGETGGTGSTSQPAAPPQPTGPEAELQELTAKVATLRRELEKLQERESES